MRSLAALVLGFCLALVARPARADAPPRATVALVVGSNRGALVARPDLHFADDDAARYYETFRMLAADEDLVLVTRFDRDSERQYASLKDRARPPTREALGASGTAIAKRVRELRAAGTEVDFYFVYAGHGDVDRGSGFLELEDGRFSATDLEALLRSVAATRSHVIIDSCNSVFMVSARKPGGQHFATGEVAAKQLAAKMPDVGVFLSTSAEGEVFEWSELGAGIFSHVVRSGISGAADANADGFVSYAELRAFVDVATRTVPNPRYRPQVFARGPNGKDDVVLFAPGAGRGKRIVVSPKDARRLTFRDADDVPWIDVHCEAAASCTLSLPDRAAVNGSIESYRIERGALVSLGRAPVDEGRPALVATSTSRGVNENLRALFLDPFGPRAFAEAPERPAEPIYGVSSADVERHRLMLRSIASSGRRHRFARAAGYAAGGALGLGTGLTVLAREGAEEPWTPGKVFAVVQTTVGASMFVSAPYMLFDRERSEELHEEFERDLEKHPGDEAGALARGERRLAAAAREARTERIIQLSLAGAIAVAQTAIFVGNEAANDPNDAIRFGVGGSLLLLGAAAFTQAVPTELERLAELWKNDPSRVSTAPPRVTIYPTVGGAAIGGRF